MDWRHRFLVGMVLMLTAALVWSGLAAASEFPQKEITLIVPVAAGGGSDMTMRALAREAERILGVPVIVVNRVGAGGAVGLSEVAKSKPDGYTLVMITEYIYTLPMTQATAFTVKTFEPIVTVNFDPAAVAVGKNSQWRSLKDLVEFAKTNPGVVTLGNSGFGNIWHLSASALEGASGARFVHVPFNGAAPTIMAALGGHISAMIASPPEMASQIQAGNLRLLGVMSEQRSAQFPDVPTLKELGYDISIGTWRGVAARAGTPEPVIKKLEEVFLKAAESPGFQEFMNKQGLGIVIRNREETARFIEQDEPRFRTLLSSLGLLMK